MLNLTKPRYVMPGPRRPQAAAAARRAGRVGRRRAGEHLPGRNGLPLEIDERGARFGEDVHAGVIFVDGVDIGEPDDVALRDRRTISADGIFIVVATVSSDDGEVGRRPGGDLPRRALPRGEATGSSTSCATWSRTRSRTPPKAGTRELHLIQEDLHDDVAEFVYERLRRRPMVLPVVVEV